MIVFTHPREWKRLRSELFPDRASVGYVPTMGALHEGHQSLISRASEENDLVVVSIYVNPTQFNQASDLSAYPRDLGTDLEIAAAAGCEVVFAPTNESIYGEEMVSSDTDYGTLTSSLEGAERPGHFNGVVTIVRKLFNAVKPTQAYFGEKDFQQLAIIREMVRRESIDVNIVGCELVRDEDGLALSSRNARLSNEGKLTALFLSKTMREADEKDRTVPPQTLAKWAFDQLENHPGIEPEYVEIVDATTLEKLNEWGTEEARILLTAWVDGVRLIDNSAI